MALKLKRNSRPIQEIPLASTADIAFLLIVFFLSASSLLEMKGVKIPIPVKDAPPMQIPKEDLFKININNDGIFYHNNKPFNSAEIESTLRDNIKSRPEMAVYILVDPEAPAQSVPELIRIIQNSGIDKMTFRMGEITSTK